MISDDIDRFPKITVADPEGNCYYCGEQTDVMGDVNISSGTVVIKSIVCLNLECRRVRQKCIDAFSIISPDLIDLFKGDA